MTKARAPAAEAAGLTVGTLIAATATVLQVAASRAIAIWERYRQRLAWVATILSNTIVATANTAIVTWER